MTGAAMRASRRAAAAALCAVVVAASAAGCAPDGTAAVELPVGPALTVGVPGGQPGLAVLRGEGYEGFDIDVAEYIARDLGYARKQIVYVPVDAADRDRAVNDGVVDVMVGYAAVGDGTDAASDDVEIAGAYLSGGLDLLIRGDESGDIASASSMDGRVACTSHGAAAATALLETAPGVAIQERDSVAQCVTALMIGETDAVAADGAVLAGFAAEHGEGYLVTLGRPYADSWRGVAVRGGDGELADRIALALRAMVADGTWDACAAELRAGTGYDPGEAPAPMRDVPSDG